VRCILPVIRKPKGFSGFHPGKGKSVCPFCERVGMRYMVIMSGYPARSMDTPGLIARCGTGMLALRLSLRIGTGYRYFKRWYI